jgi:hypothetical protein
MKLICVSQEQQTQPRIPKIEVLEEVTAINECSFCGNEYWQFKEYECRIVDGEKYRLWYDKRDFATLPTEDQEKEIECEKEAIIYQR